MHLAIPWHYQKSTQPCIIKAYTTYKKKKKKIHDDRNKPKKAIGHEAQEITQRCLNRRQGCNQLGRGGGEGDEEMRKFKR